MPLANDAGIVSASAYLSKHDAKLRPVIERYGLCTITPHTDYYAALVNSIVGQQLSVKAAAAIRKRFLGLFNEKFPTPQQILEKTVEELRAIGFSNAKGAYIRDLAQHIVDGRIRFDRLSDQTNEEIIGELTDVKGIGEWTVHMFLIFCVGRLDILPTGDLGIRNGIYRLYGLTERPTPLEVIDVARKHHWHPYESVASWYVWRSLDNAPA